jgi:hypothetical protein
MTGLTRTEVRRILSSNEGKSIGTGAHGGRRVIEGWSRDPEFSTRTGKPKRLGLGVGYGSFTRLARRYSGDIPPKATLDELQRLGAVVVTQRHVQFKDISGSASKRRARSLSQAGVQLSNLFRSMGYPEALNPTVALFDGVSVELSDDAALRVAEQRVGQNARAFLNGLESAMKNLLIEKPSHQKQSKQRLLVTVSVSKYTPPSK